MYQRRLPPHAFQVMEPLSDLSVEDVKSDLGPELWHRLLENQQDALVMIAQLRGRAILAKEQGLGKTATAVVASFMYLPPTPGACVLFVTTKSVLGQAEDDFLRWWPGLRRDEMDIIESKWNPPRPPIPVALRRRQGLHHPQCPVRPLLVERKKSKQPPPTKEEITDICECALLDGACREEHQRKVDEAMQCKRPPSKKICLITHDMFKNSLSWILEQPFYFGIFDESQVTLNLDTQITKCKMYFGQRIEYWLELTGTPMCRNNFNWYSGVATCQPRLFAKPEHFAMQFCFSRDGKRLPNGGWKKKEFYGCKDNDRLRVILRKYVLIRMTKADVEKRRKELGLPRLIPIKHRGVVFLRPSEAQKEICQKQLAEWRAMKETMEADAQAAAAAYDSEHGDAYIMSVMGGEEGDENIVEDMRDKGLYSRMLTYLAQLKRRLLEEYLEPKLETIIDQKKEKVLLWAHRKVTRRLLEEMAARHHWSFMVIDGNMSRKERKAAVASFEDPASPHKLAILSIMAAKEGITLNASNHNYVCEILPIARYKQQLEDRNSRVGQKRETYVKYLVVKDTIDEQSFNLLTTKIVNSYDVVDGVKMTPRTWCPVLNLNDTPVESRGTKRKGEEEGANDPSSSIQPPLPFKKVAKEEEREEMSSGAQKLHWVHPLGPIALPSSSIPTVAQTRPGSDAVQFGPAMPLPPQYRGFSQVVAAVTEPLSTPRTLVFAPSQSKVVRPIPSVAPLRAPEVVHTGKILHPPMMPPMGRAPLTLPKATNFLSFRSATTATTPSSPSPPPRWGGVQYGSGPQFSR